MNGKIGKWKDYQWKDVSIKSPQKLESSKVREDAFWKVQQSKEQYDKLEAIMFCVGTEDTSGVYIHRFLRRQMRTDKVSEMG